MFLDHFPSVSREQAIAALELAKTMLVAHAILLDACVPRPLRRELPGHEVRTVVEMGWAGKRNGEFHRGVPPRARVPVSSRHRRGKAAEATDTP